MASQEELRLSLKQALKSRRFDLKACVRAAKALRVTGLDPIADMDLQHWMQQLRQLDPAATAGQRARLAASLDRIELSGRMIAIRKRGQRCEARSAA